eukprot:gb/GFBE01066976.1/.p1 GENE.gb/GFBE01066976.1/~~gb/GFBE01066976.1/.p1  ORF type:complete len:322 (+),score=51.53 gb/GFBE01066976.1/:1-966(+)
MALSDSAALPYPQQPSTRSMRRRSEKTFNEQLQDAILSLDAKAMNHFSYLESQIAYLTQAVFSMGDPFNQVSQPSAPMPEIEIKPEVIQIPRYHFVFKDIPLQGSAWTSPPGLRPFSDNGITSPERASINVYNILHELCQDESAHYAVADAAPASEGDGNPNGFVETTSATQVKHFFIGDPLVEPTAHEDAWEPIPQRVNCTAFDGTWRHQCGSNVVINGGVMYDPAGEQMELSVGPGNSCSFESEGYLYEGRLADDGRLVWDDGVIWEPVASDCDAPLASSHGMEARHQACQPSPPSTAQLTKKQRQKMRRAASRPVPVI